MAGKVIQGYFVAGTPPRWSSVRLRTTAGQLQPSATASPRGFSAAQRHGGGNDAFAVDLARLGLTSTGGRALPAGVRGQMEAALGADFSGVRVHVGPQAARLGAIAFTVGADIYFAPGRYQPETVQGQQVLGHELAHVLQQRAGRVRNPAGGVAVVQDRMLEAEADRLGHQAAAYRRTLQAKLWPQAPSAAPVRISAPLSTAPGSYRLTAGLAGRPIGSVMVHARGVGAVEVTDLGVEPTQREHGVGKLLLASAARTAQQLGRAHLTLAAQDNGSGRLTRWYQQMGFTRTGVDPHGYPTLQAPASRLIGATAQTMPPDGMAKSSLQLKKKDDFQERKRKQEEAKAKGYEKEKAKADEKKKTLEKEIAKKAELKKKQEEDVARRLKQKEEIEIKKADETRDFRRHETLARFLETRVVDDFNDEVPDKTNVCVAIAVIDGTIFATTNKNKIGKLYYEEEDATLYVDPAFSVEKGEQTVDVSAKKLSAFFAAKINEIEQVYQNKSDSIHAEMKMLDFLCSELKIKTSVTIYISRLCCAKCRKAIDLWNRFGKKPIVAVREGTHAGYFPGWEVPECIGVDNELCNELFVLPKSASSYLSAEKEEKKEEPARGRDAFRDYASVTTLSQRRERSVSPAPRGAKAKFF
jgi:ribosomal protein S18 acetylase RimI-like enzyme